MYIFVIDTNYYAGNFAERLIAYCTGLYDEESGVGEEEAESFEHSEDISFCSVLQLSSMHNPGFKYGAIRPTPGYFNNGLGKHYRDDEEMLAKQEFREMREKYKKSPIDKPLEKFPAYGSVIFYMSRFPTEEEVRIIKKRSKEFFEKDKLHSFVKIVNYRILEETITTKELKLHD